MPKVKIETKSTRKRIIPLILAITNTMLKEVRFTESINEAVTWDKFRWNISPGNLLKMLVLSTFTDIRIPLTRLEDRLEGIAVSHFLEPEACKSEFVNSSNVGEAMDRLGEIDFEGFYATMALTAMQKYKMELNRLHSDTTTISFYGEYDVSKMKLSEEEQAELLNIERGYNKDGRPDCKQVVVGQITNEHGVPIVSKTMDGATSDIEWNREAIRYAIELNQKGFKVGTYVADSKLIVEEHVRMMNAPETFLSFVSRCPANFCDKLEERMIYKAYADGNWQEFSPLKKDQDGTRYKGISYIEEVFDSPVRLIVLESSALAGEAELSLTKKEQDLKPLIKSLQKKQYTCQADAEKELDEFLSRKELALFNCVIKVETQIEEKWPRGRRGANSKPVIKKTYQLNIESVSRSEPECQRFLQKESCIVLISNATAEMTDEDILKTYKGQQVVENSFRALKSPQLASVIYLKNPQRVKVLTMLLTFSLLIRAIIQYRLRDGLAKYKEENPGKTIRAGWGGRALENPTFKLLYEHCINCYFEYDNWLEYSFAWPTIDTKNRVEPLLMLMGLTLESVLHY